MSCRCKTSLAELQIKQKLAWLDLKVTMECIYGVKFDDKGKVIKK